jgi:hypothetical protein
VLQDLTRQLALGESSPLPPLAMPVCRQDGHHAEVEAAVTTQDEKVGRSRICSAVRSVGSVMSVIGSSQICGRFWADQY